MLERENVALDEKEVAARLNGDEATTGDVHPMRIVEVLHCGASRRLELQEAPISLRSSDTNESMTNLDDWLPVVVGALPHDEIEIHATVVHDLLES